MSELSNKKIIYWSKKEVALLKEVYPQMWVKDIAKMFPRRNKATIVAKARDLGLPSAKLWQPWKNKILSKNFAESTKEEFIKLFPRRSWAAILAQGERLGLKRKTNRPTLNVNEFYFRRWSPNMTYILGFIFADGNITKVTHNGYSDKLGFGIHQKDIDILQKIKQELSAEQALSISGDYVHLSIFSQVIVDDLKKLGITYRKSFRKNRGRIPNIPWKYTRHFIRGIVDGDGSISLNKRGRPTLSVCGKREIITFIRNHFLSKFNLYSKISQAKYNGKPYNLFYIAYRCNSAKALINYLYDNTNLYLERKFKLAQKCKLIEIKHRKDYTKQENRILQEFYLTLPKDKFLLKLPNRSWSNTQQQARKLNLYKYKRSK